MALTGLEIFKLLPKTNCKKCGLPTCLAFAMQLAQKKVKLDDCPCASEEAKETLAAAAAPPMRKVVFGIGETEVQIGAETVMFRHEEKFHNPAVVAVTISDKFSTDELKKRIDAINALQFERIGIKIRVQAVAIMNESNSADTFAQVCSTVHDSTDLALILISDSPEALSAAMSKTASSRPLLGCAKLDSAEAMTKIAKDNNCSLIAQADSIDGLAELSDKIASAGVEDIVLSLNCGSLLEHFYNQTRIRALGLKKVFRPFGYPCIGFVTDGEPAMQAATAGSLICKYSSIVVLDTTEPYAVLPILTTVMNIYSDPQKPVQVEPKVYPIGEPDSDSPVMFTTNFSLTYYTVESDVEASRVPSYIIVVDTEGTSVLTAYSGDKLNEKIVADAMSKFDVEKLVKHRKLIIPGYVAVMSGKLEEATNWEVMVGPRESSMIPKFLQEVWK